jgi:glycosyltransferase involved in cell wall biosynthesis
MASTRPDRNSLHKLRVIIATPLGLNGRGGIDRMNDNIFENLDSRSELNVTVRRLVTRGQRGLFAAQFVFAYALLKLLFAALLRKVDVLHIHLSNWGSSYRKTTLGAVARLLGIPYVVHLHGSGFDEFLAAAPSPLAKAVDRLLSESEQIIVLGQYWARAITDRVPQAVNKITVLPNATKLSLKGQLSALNSCVRITCIGELGERKGTPQLLEALLKMAQRQDWTATIAGNGKVEESRARISELKLGARVDIPGWLSSAETDELLCRTDILVLPSFAENLPMVILEAFAHGVPVISTPVGAIPEVVDTGRNGLLVPVGDVSGLATAIENLIGKPELRVQFGNAARQDHAKKYEIGAYVSALVEIWWKSATK